MAQLPKQIINLIESLNEDQLHALYRVVAERLNLVHKARALVAMRNFYILDRVLFTHNGKHYEGVVTRLNQKTITVTLDDGTRWGVSPGNLKKIIYSCPNSHFLYAAIHSVPLTSFSSITRSRILTGYFLSWRLMIA